MSGTRLEAPTTDVPSLSVRWEGLVVVIDTLTLNALLRSATRRVPEVREITVDAEDGRLALNVKLHKGISVRLKGYLSSFRLKDGFLGCHVSSLTAFGFLPIPDALLRRVVARQSPGLAFFYPSERVLVVNLTSVLPPDLSLQIRDVVCENGEIRAHFGPSHLRLDRLIEAIGREGGGE